MLDEIVDTLVTCSTLFMSLSLLHGITSSTLVWSNGRRWRTDSWATQSASFSTNNPLYKIQ